MMEDQQQGRPTPSSEISSKKLRDLGFTFKFGSQDIIHHTLNCCVDNGFLPPVRSESKVRIDIN